VHRDLKPSNVFVTAAGVKLIDLGAGIRSTPTLDDRLTRAGEFVGTLEYAPPEAFVGRGDSPSRDVFALGAILYECLLGQPPFEAKSVAEAITQTSAGLRKRPAELRAQISQSLDDLLVRTLSPSPAARPRDARALLEQLEAVNVAEAPRPQGPESRRDPRAVYVSPVRIQCADGRTLDGRTEDISQSGTLVVLPNGGKVEGTVRLRMVSPITGKAVAVSAVARWARSTRGRDAVGLQFNDAPEPLAAEIQSYLQVMAREQGSTVRPQAS